MRRATLMRLYPAAWRERYEEEFLQLVDEGPLSLQQAIDIVSGAIDARLRGTIRRDAEGRHVMERVIKGGCQVGGMRMTTHDALVGAGVLIATSAMFGMFGGWLAAKGYSDAAELVAGMAFPLSLAVSMPWTFMKGQPWRAQAAIVGAVVTVMGAISAVTLLF